MVSQARILRTYVITFCSQANVITFPYKRDPSSIPAGMNYLHTSKDRGIASPERFASGGDHVSSDGDDHPCTSSDNDLRLGRLDSSNDCLRANATVKRPWLTSLYEGREPAIKAKEPEVQNAGGTDGLVGEGNRFCRGKPHLW